MYILASLKCLAKNKESFIVPLRINTDIGIPISSTNKDTLVQFLFLKKEPICNLQLVLSPVEALP